MQVWILQIQISSAESTLLEPYVRQSLECDNYITCAFALCVKDKFSVILCLEKRVLNFELTSRT